MSFLSYDRRVGVDCKQVNEFALGDEIEYNDLYFHNAGRGIITSFAQADYEPTVWFKDDKDEHKTVHLGWCKKLYPKAERKFLHVYRIENLFAPLATLSMRAANPDEFVINSTFIRKAEMSVSYTFLPTEYMSEDYLTFWKVVKVFLELENVRTPEEQVLKDKALLEINKLLPKEIHNE